MQIQVHVQGSNHSPWMDEFITKKVGKLSRYMNTAASVQVHIKLENQQCLTTLSIHNSNKDYAFSADGENVYESVASAIDKANRCLSEEKRKIKDKINRRYVPLRNFAA